VARYASTKRRYFDNAAQHSWEITQVNEMLTQMERHPQPLRLHNQRAGTLGRDGGTTLPVQSAFLPMTADQIPKAFRRSFGADLPGCVLKLSRVTPADFATVSRKASVLGERDPRILTQ
jgi:transitional endoplasmic reticulum ATPase